MLSLYHVVSFCVMLLSIISSAHSGNTDTEEDIDWSKTKIWGPGLRADFCVPARYFFIQLIKFNGDNYTQSAGERPFEVGLSQVGGQRVRVYMRVLDKKDGMYLITFRIYETLRDLQITITKDDKQLGDSPFSLTGPVLQDQCYCPQPSLQQWYDTMSCPQSYTQIESDLSIFHQVDLEETAAETIQRFNISRIWVLNKMRHQQHRASKGKYYDEGDSWTDCPFHCTCVDGSKGNFNCEDVCNPIRPLPPVCQESTDCCAKIGCGATNFVGK
ncbi:protein O-glucosyltransferase 2-like [Mya arenaria]|uniref:protein O-glucosyltransferase 2-like n=1 Tax=Mya arenaria TaxID=6604 RepID=UPI0022E77DE8|nr:protein O-glucosyltransferase 2-like [Mya arenaria]